MKIPFTTEQFFEVFRNYNQAVWPAQIILYLFALTAIASIFLRTVQKSKIIFGILAVLWLWMGIMYHLLFFTTINKAAWLFGSLYLVQAFLFIWYGVWRNRIKVTFKIDFYSFTGILFILYGLLIYPILGHFLGHSYPGSPTFGLPCPTTIFTFGMLLMMNSKVPMPIVIVPLLWSIIGFFAAINFRIKEDVGLLIAGIFGFIFILMKNRTFAK